MEKTSGVIPSHLVGLVGTMHRHWIPSHCSEQSLGQAPERWGLSLQLSCSCPLCDVALPLVRLLLAVAVGTWEKVQIHTQLLGKKDDSGGAYLCGTCTVLHSV